jgi:site-specific DNA-methyltransferase (adenine-specific)/modification methylase
MLRKEVIGDATLYLGDCMEVLPLLPKHDLALTDPPFGLGTKLHGGTWGTNAETWDNVPAPDWLFGLLREKTGALIVWGGNYYALPLTRGWLAWRKPDAPPSMAHLELAWTSYDMNAKMLDHSIAATNAERAGHPTQKPVRVMAWSLEFAPDAQTVLDPFMGSGTTGVACAQLGKAFTGIEREPKYFDIACRRIEQAYKQRPLFEAEPQRQPIQTEIET